MAAPDGSERAPFDYSATQLRDWLDHHHGEGGEVWVRIEPKSFPGSSITWSEVVDQALCFGWIDSVSKPLGDGARSQRLSPRRPRSNWSVVNVRKVEQLTAQGLMHPAGIEAFERRSEERTGVYSHEATEETRLEADHERRLRADEAAWRFFEVQAPWYRRAAIHHVISAKRESTRERRLDQLIECSREGRRIPQLAR